MADFSIVTPVLNQVSTIEACILSVANQEVDIEHIVIDGGSTDGTLEIIQKHQNKLSYWVSEKDAGQSNAINKGLKLASGNFFNWLNADDLLLPNALIQVKQSTKPTTQIVIGKCRHVDSSCKEIAIGSARIWESLEATLGNYSMSQPTVFYKTKAVVELGGLNEDLHLCMDMDLWFRFLLKHGQKNILSIDSVLGQFLVHPTSKSSLLYQEMEAEKYGLYNLLLSQFNLPDVIHDFFQKYPAPNGIIHDSTNKLNSDELLSNFAWHLMIDAYEAGNSELCQQLFDVVKLGSRLSSSEKLLWKARIASDKLLNR